MMPAFFRPTALAMLLLLPGCAGQAPAPGEAIAHKSVESKEAQIRLARMGLDIARQGTVLAEAELRSQELESQAAAGRIRRELELATARLAQFRDVESVRKLQQAQLETQRARDQIDDTREELAQLEKLYQGNDLADATKEIVLKRGRRALERAGSSLAIKELELKTLQADLLPAELAKMQLEADQKKDELERSLRGAEIGLQQKKVALARTQVELQKAVTALADLEKK